MEREFHFHCSSFSEEAERRSLTGTEPDKEHFLGILLQSSTYLLLSTLSAFYF